ncbi:SDR family oxidoreductase [Acinetobacter baumannii]|uniref:SDR family NAD(P)-dependent oxidoreductase n=1 Tax=Acinetobacter baumannii TaxID=470 RepID=UPI00234046AE|nr:SDR family oxidoreductase [Acinetobacter baumannii]MDC4585196.1 SDR family oxidoreductase [Acinetobacter baumannii]MDD7976265.1 SDR family oxidoreductase [Acinetobacter baumannii]MDK2127747.1 SDR family oxidoreductase [Acinetobacter baumannii]MDK2157991.1 SDR family oxidoreductase [Acinetobacter baumannii]MDK2165901.1 SDR family oxidoreductase [Acinetobacter baumannii]
MPNEMFSTRVALITGAGGEIGQALCRRLHKDGFNIIAVDISAKVANQLIDDLNQARKESAQLILADLGSCNEIEALISEVQAKYNQVDVLVNNAALNLRGSIFDFKADDWDKMFAVNLRAPALLSQKLSNYFMAQNSGRIINIVSRCWVAGGPPAYVSCKAGLVGLTRSMARELAPYNVTVNAIAPGILPSAFTLDGRDIEAFNKIAENAIEDTPIKRLTTPEDVANTAAFLASNDSSFITAEVIHVCGGGQLAPFGRR